MQMNHLDHERVRISANHESRATVGLIQNSLGAQTYETSACAQKRLLCKSILQMVSSVLSDVILHSAHKPLNPITENVQSWY